MQLSPSLSSADVVSEEDVAALIVSGNIVDLGQATGDHVQYPRGTVRRLKSCDQVQGELWHIAVRRLRCFVLPTQFGKIIHPVRPRVLIISRVRPFAILSCSSCSPDHDFMSSDFLNGISSLSVLEQISLCIDAPRSHSLKAGVSPRHRPSKILFDHRALAQGCRNSLSAIGVQTALLKTPPARVDRFVAEFSQGLLRNKVAVVTDIQMQPIPPMIMLDVKSGSPSGVTDLHLRPFLRLVRLFVKRQVWNDIPERQNFRIRMESPGTGAAKGEPLIAWTDVMGYAAVNRRKMVFPQAAAAIRAQLFGDREINPEEEKKVNAIAMQQVQQKIPLELGIRVWFKRYDAEQKLLAAAPSQENKGVPPIVSSAEIEPNLADMRCAFCSKTVDYYAESLGKDLHGDRELSAEEFMAVYKKARNCLRRCSQCAEVYYCVGSDPATSCQKQHWKSHKAFCESNKLNEWVPPPSPGAPIARRPGYWANREILCLFKYPHECPFGDLDLFERVGHHVSTPLEVPFALTFEKGVPRRPSLGELTWIMRSMSAILEFSQQRPDRYDDVFTHDAIEEELFLTGGCSNTPISASDSFAVSKAAELKSSSQSTLETSKKSAVFKSRKSCVDDCCDGEESGAGAAVGSIRSAAEQLQLELDDQNLKPWYEVFGEGLKPPTAFVRADAIFKMEEFSRIQEDVGQKVESSFDPAIIKEGLYVPSHPGGMEKKFEAGSGVPNPFPE